mmetsp:Transcript_14697/g.26646  ORF Transcript_14697/g.26646 Transcript_14697/m.26646 type:complete len:521 (+) Transcript_14697:118-1680(+)
MADNQQEQLKGILKPHPHDVLSGRGNFVNHHAGNENFRKLVKHHKKAYVACPKAQKAIYSKIIYDEIRAMDPPGRFLKQDPKTKLWGDIGEKKALDKTRQALREGAPELLKELECGMDVDGNGGTGGNNGGEDFVTPLQRIQRNGHPLTMSLGSFSLGSNGNNFTAGSFPAGSSVPTHVGVNDANLFAAQGPGSILAAAAQLQAQQQQQQHQQQQQQKPQMQLEAQLQILKMQMNSQQANLAAQQGAAAMGGMGNNQAAGFNAMVAAAQAQASNGNLPMGSNDMTALLSAIHNSASGMNNAGGMANPAAAMAYQQQLAQVAMFNQMNSMRNDSENTMAGNLNNVNNRNNIGNNGGASIFGNTGNNNQNFLQTQQQQSQQHQSQHQQEHTFNISVPLKSSSNSNIDPSAPKESSNSNRRAMGGGLNSSFTRAQRIGLKNSFTQRRPNRHLNNADMHNTLKSSLMSIESLTLDDIDGSDFGGGNMEGVFEDDESRGSKGGRVHGRGPHDMSDVSALEYEEKN